MIHSGVNASLEFQIIFRRFDLFFYLLLCSIPSFLTEKLLLSSGKTTRYSCDMCLGSSRLDCSAIQPASL